jgi:hypothetical protein
MQFLSRSVDTLGKKLQAGSQTTNGEGRSFSPCSLAVSMVVEYFRDDLKAAPRRASKRHYCNPPQALPSRRLIFLLPIRFGITHQILLAEWLATSTQRRTNFAQRRPWHPETQPIENRNGAGGRRPRADPLLRRANVGRVRGPRQKPRKISFRFGTRGRRQIRQAEKERRIIANNDPTVARSFSRHLIPRLSPMRRSIRFARENAIPANRAHQNRRSRQLSSRGWQRHRPERSSDGKDQPRADHQRPPRRHNLQKRHHREQRREVHKKTTSLRLRVNEYQQQHASNRQTRRNPQDPKPRRHRFAHKQTVEIIDTRRNRRTRTASYRSGVQLRNERPHDRNRRHHQKYPRRQQQQPCPPLPPRSQQKIQSQKSQHSPPKIIRIDQRQRAKHYRHPSS